MEIEVPTHLRKQTGMYMVQSNFSSEKEPCHLGTKLPYDLSFVYMVKDRVLVVEMLSNEDCK